MVIEISGVKFACAFFGPRNIQEDLMARLLGLINNRHIMNSRVSKYRDYLHSSKVVPSRNLSVHFKTLSIFVNFSCICHIFRYCNRDYYRL